MCFGALFFRLFESRCRKMRALALCKYYPVSSTDDDEDDDDDDDEDGEKNGEDKVSLHRCTRLQKLKGTFRW